MEGDVAEAEEALRQLDELAELEQFSRWTDLDSVVGRVVGGSFTNFENTIQIDRGTDDGVAVGMPVVTGSGLAGRVVAATSSRSTVQLITDPGFDIGIRLAVTGEVGVAHGTGEGRPLVVDQGIPVNLEDNVRTREPVTTSGVSRSAFPPDIPVGRVTEVERGGRPAQPGALHRPAWPTSTASPSCGSCSGSRRGDAAVRAFRAGLVLLTAVVLQAAVVSRLDVFGAHADLLVLVPIAVALVDGPERGAMAGFVAGLAVDLLSTTPFGLTALAYSVVGFVRRRVPARRAAQLGGAARRVGHARRRASASWCGRSRPRSSARRASSTSDLLVVIAVVSVAAGLLVRARRADRPVGRRRPAGRPRPPPPDGVALIARRAQPPPAGHPGHRRGVAVRGALRPPLLPPGPRRARLPGARHAPTSSARSSSWRPVAASSTATAWCWSTTGCRSSPPSTARCWPSSTKRCGGPCSPSSCTSSAPSTRRSPSRSSRRDSRPSATAPTRRCRWPTTSPRSSRST